jgi:hypothetical protein
MKDHCVWDDRGVGFLSIFTPWRTPYKVASWTFQRRAGDAPELHSLGSEGSIS